MSFRTGNLPGIPDNLDGFRLACISPSKITLKVDKFFHHINGTALKKLVVCLFAGIAVACQPEIRKPVSLPVFHPQSYVGYWFSDTEGTVLDSFQANRYFIPASLTKLYFYPVLKQVSGDPSFSSTTWNYDPADSTLRLAAPGNPLLGYNDLRNCILTSGPVKRVILYHLPYDSSRVWGAGWMADDEPADYQPYFSAVPVNLNVQTVTVQCTRDSITILQEPWELPYRIKPGSSLSVTRPPASDTLLVTIPPDSSGSVTRKLSIRNPSRYLYQWLRASSLQNVLSIVTVPQLPVFSNRIAHDPGELTHLILNQSNNLAAEQILRYWSLKNGGNGSVAGYLKQNPVPAPDGRLVDGSGLSRYNMLTPAALGKVLQTFRNEPAFKTGLAIYGESGTLDDWFRLADTTAVIVAKSGSMNTVQNLAGLILIDGQPAAEFVLMINFWMDSKESRYRLEKAVLDRWISLVRKNTDPTANNH